MDLSDRIKEIRKLKKLSQSAFGEKLGVSRDVINNAENGRAVPNDLFIQHLCEIYSVNEEWLRHGSGDPLRQDENTVVSQLVSEFSLDELGQAIIRGYMHLNSSQKAAIKGYIKSVASEFEKIEDSQTNETKSESNRITDEIDPDIKQELNSYRQELEMEKSIRTSSASPRSGENVS